MPTLLLHGGDLPLTYLAFLAVSALAFSVGIVVLGCLAFRAYVRRIEQRAQMPAPAAKIEGRKQ